VSYRKKVEEKLSRKEKAYETEQLMKEKRSEEYEVLEEVFDRSTLMTVYDLMNKGVIDEIHGVVKAGKESRVYWGIGSNGREIAIKIYLTVSSEFKRGRLPYIEGDPRFRRVRRNIRHLVYLWAQKEFKNLQAAYQAKVRVPEPIAVRNNVLVMEFIGKNGISAPLMKEVTLKNPERIYRRLITYLKRLYRGAELVHGDLSEYNVMIWRGVPVLFDVSQAVSIQHPMADQFLLRDLQNLNRYFSKLGVEVLPIDELYRRVTGVKA